ncbi:RHS repeat-associated core domain-containing protein [Stenotrophomonas maltophilia]|uniref:RHS repeat-associated core domain-containing protein n=1 Tax=Stenotrophomonas maltophilia TaxID=40324 RepID=UPI002ACCAD30|nr:RHS repeat-associated core domain-containing protein [Stenotrophomonas maltophilia]MDZ5842799.1 RHS repeat-associated core domain-containing protein [Stenotrophomonas maltophilia]
MNTQPCFKALSGIGRMRRFGGTAGGVSTRFRRIEDRIRKLGAFGAWLCCVLLLGLGVSPAAIAQTTVTYIHTDALGSVVAESDANGNVIKRYDYEPYGAVVGGQVTDGPGYTGHVSDSATGLSYMQQRYMDPQLGVFLSVDPVTAYQKPVEQFNRYRYANGNPYKFTDPDGRQAIPMPAPYILPIPVPHPGGNIQRSEDTSGGNRESGPSGRPTSRPTERPAGRDTVRRGRDGQPIPGSRGESGRSPSPFIPSDPYSPESTSGRQSETRRNEGASSSDPDSVIPDRGPGSDQGGHASRGRTPHDTGERNVNRNEEHSRRPKGNPTGRSR